MWHVICHEHADAGLIHTGASQQPANVFGQQSGLPSSLLAACQLRHRKSVWKRYIQLGTISSSSMMGQRSDSGSDAVALA